MSSVASLLKVLDGRGKAGTSEGQGSQQERHWSLPSSATQYGTSAEGGRPVLAQVLFAPGRSAHENCMKKPEAKKFPYSLAIACFSQAR